MKGAKFDQDFVDFLQSKGANEEVTQYLKNMLTPEFLY